MKSNLKVVSLIFVLLGFTSSSCDPTPEINDAVKNVFLTKHFNSTESEWILKSARENYLILKDFEKNSNAENKINFFKNYAHFLLKLLKEVQTKEVDVYQVFSKENSFLNECNLAKNSEVFNLTELEIVVDTLQTAAEKQIIARYNSTQSCVEIFRILGLNDSSFDAFIKEKFQGDYSEIGYFLLEVFVHMIGFSWGLISTVLYYIESTTENIVQSSVL